MKLYFGNTTTTITTLMILCLLGFIGYTIFQRANILYWGRRTLFVLVFGFGYLLSCGSQRRADKTIQHTIDGSCAPGIFPLLSIPNLTVHCALSLLYTQHRLLNRRRHVKFGFIFMSVVLF